MFRVLIIILIYGGVLAAFLGLALTLLAVIGGRDSFKLRKIVHRVEIYSLFL